MITIISCKDDEFGKIEPISLGYSGLSPMTRAVITPGEDAISVFGRKLNNPYSVSNMKQAVRILNQTRSENELTESDINTTHYYVKFSLQNEDQIALLKSDTLVEFYNHPLDVEILSEGIPERDEESAIYEDLYAVYKVNKTIPNLCPYTILENLYIPDEDDNIPTRGGVPISESYIISLVNTSMQLTGNENDMSEPSTRYKQAPFGIIRVWDDAVNNYLPVSHAKVRGRRWFTTHIGYTDRDGHYLLRGTFHGSCRFSIVWESPYWDVRSGTLNQAYTNGPKKKGNWSHDINGGKAQRYAIITNACTRIYHPTESDGFTEPIMLRSLKLSYYHKHGDKRGSFYYDTWTGVLPDIKIYGATNVEGWRATHELFTTVCHELGHAAHCMRVGKSKYKSTDKIVRESWANLVGWRLADYEYQMRGYPNAIHTYHSIRVQPYNLLFEIGDNRNFQGWTKFGDKEYTPIFIDLWDGTNQRQYQRLIGNTSSANNYPNDMIYCHNSQILQEVVFSSRTLQEIKTKLLKWDGQYGISQYNLDQLFEFYN